MFKLYVAKDVPIHNSFGKQFLEIATMATKIYATSSVILFCLASLAIANQFDNIRYQVEENMHLFNNTAEILMRLQSQYSSGKMKNKCIFLNNISALHFLNQLFQFATQLRI